jgi:uncharacterized membrane protein
LGVEEPLVSIEETHQDVGRFTHRCRWICSGVLAAPLLYWWSLAYEGDAAILLVLALLSLVAGLVLLGISMFCVFRYRNRKQLTMSFFFLFLSVFGVLAMPHVLPGWKM